MNVFKRVLVALDGSPFSEQALALLDAIRGESEPECALLRVVTPAEVTDSGRDRSELLEEARQYLESLGKSRQRNAVTVVADHAEDPAERILAETEGRDLVVLMTHGRSGIKRWVWGSVAERVVRHCAQPLLLGSSSSQQPQRIERILVPLDGSEHAASVLELAGALARQHGAELVLFRAAWVDPTNNMLVYARETEALKQEILAELETVAETLRAAGTQVSPKVSLSYPAEAILAAAQATDSDLIAMTTHGRTGLKRWLLGSVAEKVLRGSTRPVLLVRVPDEKLS